MPSLHPLLSWALVASSSIGLAACGGGGGSGSIQPGVFGTGVATSEAADRFFVQDPGIAPPILESTQPSLSTVFNNASGSPDMAAASLGRILSVLTAVSPEPLIASRLGGLQFGMPAASSVPAGQLMDRNGNGIFDLGDSLVRGGTSGSETIDLVGFSSTTTGPAALLRITYANFQAAAGGPTLSGVARVFYERTGTNTSTTSNKITLGNSQYSVAGGVLPANNPGTFKVRRSVFQERASLLPLRGLELLYEGPSPGLADVFAVLLQTDPNAPLIFNSGPTAGGLGTAFSAGGTLVGLVSTASGAVATSARLLAQPTAQNIFTAQVFNEGAAQSATPAAQASGIPLTNILNGSFDLVVPPN